ncbi:unnamed protein product [Periconia digitata]|uniref:EthD domain-containing protein n=1 Tax=Periconia digitata TaxID=1303443 RepID=A0A9W4U8M5_9PLEO|nr:unnamed protein product [Periconia digitata]
MKFNTLLSFLPIVAASCGAAPPAPQYTNNTDISVPEQCCCLTYKAACTMNMERMFHVKLFYNRKEGITPEQFNDYWANKHTELVTPFHLRIGVVKYSQYHSTPEFRDLARAEGAPPILEFDGAAEFWMHDIQTLAKMQSDPFYIEKIRPDEEQFIDGKSLKLIVGVDYIVVENQNAVMEHGRSF